jgi:hypothetical protein
MSGAVFGNQRGLREQEERARGHEPNEGREKERIHRVGDLGPVHAVAERTVGTQERVHEPDTDDRADQRVRAGGRKAEVPGAEIPDDRGEQEREHPGKAGARTDVDHELDRQERHDAEGD